jgi:hypothetical protein
LGSASFAEREQATRQLTRLGIVTKEALTAAAADPDRELRARARDILATVRQSDFRDRLEAFSADYDGRRKQTLPGWERFAQVFGPGHQARQLFVEMQRDEPALLEAYAEGGRAADAALQARCQELLEQLTHATPRETLFSVGTAATLLLVGSADDVRVDEQLGIQLYSWMIYQPSFSKIARGGPWSGMLKKLLGMWIVKDSGSTATAQNLVLAASYELKSEGLHLAEKVLSGNADNPQLRQFALLAIGRFGDRKHIPLVEKFLADATACGAIQANNPPLQVELQIRDVVLAVLIHLTDQRVADYGGVVGHMSPQSVFQVPSLGFPKQPDRDAALARWASWRAEQLEP